MPSMVCGELMCAETSGLPGALRFFHGVCSCGGKQGAEKGAGLQRCSSILFMLSL
jgi:hypothetical protein